MSDTPFTEFTLGKYRAVALLGKGGFGTVFHALDSTLDREVALKVLHPQLAADPNFVTRFRQEAKIIAALRHPNVVGVYELGEAEGRLFIAMEYMPGGTLKDRITQQGHLSFDETLRIMQQVCAGLDAAHAEGMIHRDIKPGNILFDKRGNAVVGDFGLARAVQLSSMASSSSSSVGGVGTSFYKAPELWNGKPPVSPATDVYALACMVYEMLMGHLLFEGDTPAIIMTKHVLHGPEYGSGWPPVDAPQGLAEVIQRGIAHNPEDRYASAKALAEALAETSAPVPLTPQKDVGQAMPADEAKPVPTTATGSTSKRILVAAFLIPLILIGGWLLLREVRLGEAPAVTPTSTLAEVPPMPTAIPVTTTPALSIGSKQVSDKDGMILLYVPAGEFTMGSNDGEGDEKPVHTVYLDAFWIDQTEVTNAMFKRFIDATGYQTDAEKQSNGLVFDTATKTWSDLPGANWQYPRGPGSDLNGLDNHPVVQISWNDARAYCQRTGGDLPTEAQWEKAARGSDGRIYPWGDQAVAGNLLNSADRSLDVNWADKSIDDGYQFTASVSHYPAGASPYGVLDMAGNVWEWVRDWYDDKYYASSPARNPENTTTSDARLLRGGSWNNEAPNQRASNRLRSIPANRDEVFGFRCAQSAQ